jgi:hypothetical protein
VLSKVLLTVSEPCSAISAILNHPVAGSIIVGMFSTNVPFAVFAGSGPIRLRLILFHGIASSASFSGIFLYFV